MAPDSLPSSTDIRPNNVHGASKFSQLGPEACGTVLAQLFLNSEAAGTSTAMVVVDPNAGVGDWLDGFISTRSAVSTSLFYFGVSGSQSELDWLNNHIQTSLTSKMQSGSMPLPGGAKLKDRRGLTYHCFFACLCQGCAAECR